MITIDLTMPPSLNNLFFNLPKGRGRAPCRKYLDWQNENGWQIQAKRPGRISGEVRIDIRLEDKHPRRDADNAIKPICDLLVKHGVIEGDNAKFMRDVRARWDREVTGARVSVFPLPKL